MTTPFAVNLADARVVLFDRTKTGIQSVSRRLVTEEHTPAVAVYHSTIEPPIDYRLSLEQDLIYYGLEGEGKVTVGSDIFDLRPGTALFMPARKSIRHVANERNIILIIWSPAPNEDEDTTHF